MNIALCWFGEYRNADIALKFNKFENLRNNHLVIDFISTWTHRISSQSPEYNELPYSYREEIITKSHLDFFLNVDNCSINSNIYDSVTDSMIYHFKKLVNDIYNHNLDFDVIIFLRLDTIYNIDFSLLDNFDFNNKIVVQAKSTDKSGIVNYIHDILFISNQPTMIKFVNNLKTGSNEVTHTYLSKIIKKLGIKCFTISEIFKQKKYSIIVRYIMRKYLKSLENIDDDIIKSQQKYVGKFYQSHKII